MAGGGSIVGTINIFWSLYKEPKLEYKGTGHNDEPAYHITLLKTRGKGKAHKCEGFVTVEGTKVYDMASPWSLYGKRVVDIGEVPVHLRLFKLIGRDYIEFLVVGYEGDVAQTIRCKYDDIVDKKLTVKMTSDDALIPKPYTHAIRDIISNSKDLENY